MSVITVVLLLNIALAPCALSGIVKAPQRYNEHSIQKRTTCVDADTTGNCAYWQEQGYCDTASGWYSFMTENCAVTCFWTDTETTGNCPFWQGEGYCDTASEWYTFMSNNCAVTCGICPTPASPPPTTAPSGGGGDGGSASAFNTECLNLHNIKRALHQSTTGLVYSETLAQHAQAYADAMGVSGVFDHDPNIPTDEGENLAFDFTADAAGKSCAFAVPAWYAEISLYSYSNPGFSSSTGHFTQVVWASTTQVGCGKTVVGPSAAGFYSTYIVCRYSPGGNLNTPELFQANVKPLI